LIEHARRRIENNEGLDEFIKSTRQDEEGEYTIYCALGEPRSPDGSEAVDRTQGEYRIGYGLKCYQQGKVVAFARYNPEDYEGRDSSASKILSDVFTPMIERTSDYLERENRPEVQE
jgi:hypothetical protein